MAKGRRSSSHSAQKLNVKPKDKNIGGHNSYLRISQLPKSDTQTSTTEIIEESPEKLLVDTSAESLITEIDSNNRIFLLKDESRERIECRGLPSGFAPSYRRQIIIAARNHKLEKNAVEASSEHQHWTGPDPNPEMDMLAAEHKSNGRAGRKRRPAPVNTSPTKRRRSNLIEETKSTKAPEKWESPEEVEREEEEVEEKEDEDEDEDDDEFEGITFETRDVRVCDLDEAMGDIMKSLQQKGLKRILKVWLNTCHVQKQAKFPYNGGRIMEQLKKTNDAVYSKENPGLQTAPDYWPDQGDRSHDKNYVGSCVRHKEPDHLLKHERTNLCKALLRAGNRFKDATFDLDKMEESTINLEHEHGQDFRPSARRLIDSLYYARRKEIEYENGEIDADTIVYLDMKAPRMPRPQKRTHVKKTTKFIKQCTPELATFFDYGPIKHSPSAKSSFTSVFDRSIRIESGQTTPLPDELLSASTCHSQMASQMKKSNLFDPSRSSDQSTLIREGQSSEQRGEDNAPSPSEGDTEADALDMGPEHHDQKNSSTENSMDIRRTLQNEEDDHRRKDVATSNLPAISSFHQGLLGQQEGSQAYSSSGAEQYPAAIHSSPSMRPPITTLPNFRPVDEDSSNCCNSIPPPYGVQYTPTQHIGPSAFYAPYSSHPGPNNQLMTHLPTPGANLGFSMSSLPASQLMTAVPVSQAQNFAHGYPSVASSEFNGAMPIDADLHHVHDTFEIFRDGTYQQQHAANMAPANNAMHYYGQPQVQVQQGLQDQKRQSDDSTSSHGAVWATEWESMAHDPRRYCPSTQAPPPTPVQMQITNPSATVASGAGLGHGGIMQRMGSAYGCAPSMGGAR